MHKSLGPCLALAAILSLAACASDRHDRVPQPEQWHPTIDMLLRYGVNPHGPITRADLLKGLHAAFARDDTNHDGHLDEDETRAVNERRWAHDGSTATPLVDWNHDGYVDFDEFAAAPLSLFDQLDTNGDGVLSPAEIKASKGPKKARQKRGEGNWGGHDRGRRRGGELPGGDGDGD